MGERDLIALEQYDISVIKTGKGREAIICETSDMGRLLLKEYDGSEEKAFAESSILSELSKKISVDGYVLNKEGRAVTMLPDGRKYVLKTVVSENADLHEVDLNNIEEISLAVEALANLHIEFDSIIKNNGADSYLVHFNRENMFWDNILRHHKELRRVRNYIRGQRKKNDFEYKVLECFNLFYEQGEKVLDYISGFDKDSDELSLCHGNFNQHNILISGRSVSIINFEKAAFSYQVMDLYFFMRKCLEKQNYNIELGMKIIDKYNSIKKISDTGKQILYILFLYPEKFWKIVNHYYNANKAWVSEKNISKLQALIEQEDSRQKFLFELSML